MRHYLITSAALGLLGVWGSENLFWTAPPDGLSWAELGLTWLAYSVCAAAALSMVLTTRVQGWRAAFLGGAVLGWLVEGVVVATMYAAFPFQLVWTPLAWHALVTGLLVLGMGRAAGGWSWPRRLAAWGALGLAGGLWAGYWPLEHEGAPDLPLTAAYLLGWGLFVPVAHLAFDRIGVVTPPRPWVLLAAPTLLALAWVIQVATVPNPVFLALPVLLGLTWWVMRGIGAPDAEPGLRLGPRGGPAAHAAFLVTPLVASGVAGLIWAAAPDGLEVNVPVALVTVPLSVVLFARLVREARSLRRRPS